jgi:hypothetical protein
VVLQSPDVKAARIVKGRLERTLLGQVRREGEAGARVVTVHCTANSGRFMRGMQSRAVAYISWCRTVRLHARRTHGVQPASCACTRIAPASHRACKEYKAHLLLVVSQICQHIKLVYRPSRREYAEAEACISVSGSRQPLCAFVEWVGQPCCADV